MTPDDVARAIIAEGQTARTDGPPEVQHPVIMPLGIQIALAAAMVESNERVLANPNDPDSENFPHDGEGYDHLSDGEFQQQEGPTPDTEPSWWGTAAERMDPRLSAAMFYHSLARLDYTSYRQSPGSYAQDVQGSAYPDRYDQRMPDAIAQYHRLTSGGPPPVSNRPGYNEFAKWSPNCESRNGARVDLFLLHTQEGGGGNAAAEDLANFLDNPASQVSYHYTISQASDGGVTVVDVVDTDQASWSVLSANDRSINLCFAGSSVNWTRDQWLQQSHAIDVAAYLAVQDCRKYGIQIRVLAPPYNSDPPGISDHKYVTQWLGDGTHTDVGDNFPWDFFIQSINKYAGEPA